MNLPRSPTWRRARPRTLRARAVHPAVFTPSGPAHELTANPAICFAPALSLALRLWLAARQHAHVRAHRQAVPAAFAGQVSLADHQKRRITPAPKPG